MSGWYHYHLLILSGRDAGPTVPPRGSGRPGCPVTASRQDTILEAVGRAQGTQVTSAEQANATWRQGPRLPRGWR